MEATAQGSRGPTISDGIEPDVSNSTISTDEPRSPSSNEFLTDNVDDPPGPTDDSEQPKNRTFSDPSLSTSKLLDVEGYENEEIQKLSQAIDRFRELKLEKHVALPQLVVAGNQSSGKSSLLESLTGVPFPKGYGLCTRYATEITLRGAPNESIEFSVTTTTSTPSDRKDRINKFGKQVRAKSDVGTFQSLLTELDWVFWGAHSRSDENLAARGFAQEMLKIEISGPQLKPLKFIDTPGLFSSESLKQTKDDAKTVNTLVENLIHPDRTIIVAVMDCRGNPETQSIFRLAANADPERHRTIGVLTKCDLLLESGEIAQVVKVAQNQVMQLSRGWFAVNNRSERDLKDQLSLSQTRRNEEKFFCNSEWSGINNIERTGIQRLKAFLGERFCHHLRDEFPKILDEIKLKLAKAEEERDALGPPRATEGEQREYLLRVAETFERTIDRSIADHVSSSPEDCPSRLWPQLRQLADTFTNDMRQNGHLRVFDSKIGEPTERSLRNAGRPIHGYCHGQGNETDESETETDENLTEYARIPEIEANLQEGEEGSMDEVPPIRFDSNIRPRNIYTWINRNYHTSMGRGIACPANYDLLESLFRDQSGPWRRIAFKYLKAAENVLITLIDFALSKSQSDESITKRISALLKSEAERCFKEARIRLREILRAERCFMQTTDESFLKALSKARTLRATEALKRIASQTGTGLLSISLQSLDDIGNTENQTRNHVYDTHDYLREYYKLSLRRFVDSVSVYVVNGYLLSPSGPLRILNREYVCSLYPHQLNAIAGEDFKTLSRRQILKETIDGLSNALTITDQTLGPMYFSMPKPPQVNGENTRTGPSKSIKSVASGPGPSSSAISLFKSQQAIADIGELWQRISELRVQGARKIWINNIIREPSGYLWTPFIRPSKSCIDQINDTAAWRLSKYVGSSRSQFPKVYVH
ncbi:MAG: succinate dehydrogenase assembly factor 2 [Chaenotheca gracillima]|nr:MAG: succinate dehydrogenase assembly factor 2 [Chaenotheca gracillima]